MDRVTTRFARVETRRRVGRFLLGLTAGLGRTNCWTVSEHAGETSPDGMQRLLSRAVWDNEAVRDDLRDYVVERLGEAGAVLVVDETGDLKKGTATVGVQRQYTGTAGRIENAQVAVYLAYAADRGRAFIDRALYLPKSWTGDPDRLAAAGVPPSTVFQTKPALARGMLTRAFDAGTPARWVTADEVYGNDPKLRAELARRGVGYVLAVASNHRVRTGIGVRKAVELAVRLPARSWQRLSAGAGSKGQRYYDWAMINTVDQDLPGRHWLLIRRNRRTGEYAFYRAHAPGPIPLSALVHVAGRRWAVEETIQTAKELAALDQHQVRKWTSWHRWTILAMLAHAFLTILAASERDQPAPPGLLPLTVNEVRRLFTTLTVRTTSTVAHVLHWSQWRRRHQAAARTSHCRQRNDQAT
ncbi:IS701 family transposase [Frankia sp. AgPm24]|uniref:IS701 family transposase n=1 Tax=Frankia sp. AgPm24 TaxID=631128 RepID=UPI00200E8804|nr:IS701 family transposase [Frankia sp. AgPm24]MCK9921194.1 IS701 family transposase [Frankia sp. AgPm24]